MRCVMPFLDPIDGDTPLRLSVSATVAFPEASMTASGLRRDFRRNLKRNSRGPMVSATISLSSQARSIEQPRGL
jgi:hypothetical protein